MPEEVVTVRDINPEVLQPPYALQLARGVSALYLRNGARTFGFHAAPPDQGSHFLTAIIDETSPLSSDPAEKLIVQGGAQYGCSVRICPFCIYRDLPYHRNLSVDEMVDLFRLALFLHARRYDHIHDQRQLVLKFTDNGEPLENPALIAALDKLLALFGKKDKVLFLKVSTVGKSSARSRATFQYLCQWQKQNFHQVSVHLQISVIPGVRGLVSPTEARELADQWVEANPRDMVCFAPGLAHGYDQTSLLKYCREMAGLRQHCFFRLSVIKPSCPAQETMVVSREELARINTAIEEMGLMVSPLPQNSRYDQQLRSVGTLSHLPGDGRFYDPATYQVWDCQEGGADPNTPL
ncbi:hypothetical protein KJ903_02650 [Patescibacteria group bacterium]|nr:hypothetical protein [Patescibacteria group bacterium]